MTTLSSAITTLTKRLAPGWTHRIVHGQGTTQRQRNDPDLRKRIVTQEPCTSVSLRLRHVDGRAAAAVWVDGKFDTGWIWTVCRDDACALVGTDHPGGLPHQVDSAALRLYVGAPSLEVFANALDGLIARRAVSTAKAAATRAARRAEATELSDYGTTDIKGEAA